MNIQLAFQYPPDVKKSLIHRQANKIFRKINFSKTNPQRCDCCGRFVGQQSNADCIFYHNRLQFEFLGSGIPLLFSFMKNMIGQLLFLIIIVTIYALLSNVFDKNCSLEENNLCQNDILSRISFANKQNNNDGQRIQIYLIFLMTIIWIFINQMMIYNMRQNQQILDIDVESPSDFAILIQNIPEKVTEQSIVDMISQRKIILSESEKQQTQDFKIKNVIILKKLIQYSAEQQKEFQRFQEAIRNDSYKDFKRQIIEMPTQFAHSAIVIFQKQISKDYFVNNKDLMKKIMNYFGHNKEKYICINEQQISIQRAPEPDDIIWQNIGKNKEDITHNKIKTFLIGVGLLAIGGAVQYGLVCWQLTLTDSLKLTISILSSIIVSLSNYLITKMIVWCTKKQGNLSNTLQNQSLIIKILFFQFFNSGVFYVFVNSYAADFNGNNWFSIFYCKITIFIIFNSFSEPLITLLLDYSQFPSCLYRYLIEKDYDLYYSQKRCNSVYELPDPSIEFKYAYILRTMWLTFFFTPFVPIISIISLLGLFLNYLTYKFLFRYCYKIPLIKSTELNEISTILSYPIPLLLNIGQLFLFTFHQTNEKEKLDSTTTIIVYLSLSISIACILIPWININKYLFRLSHSSYENYDSHVHNFEITYETAYPLCMGQKSINRDCTFILSKSKEFLKLNSKNPLPISKEYLTSVAVIHVPVDLNSQRINLREK